MFLFPLISIAAAAIFEPDDVVVDVDIQEEYSCVVYEKAGVASIHLEGSDPPIAFAEHNVLSTFGLTLSSNPVHSRIVVATESEDRGNSPDRTQYHTDYSLLHSEYLGDGTKFTAEEDQGFLRLTRKADGSLSFYHAGFEYPGGVDVRLSVRFGKCEPRD